MLNSSANSYSKVIETLCIPQNCIEWWNEFKDGGDDEDESEEGEQEVGYYVSDVMCNGAYLHVIDKSQRISAHTRMAVHVFRLCTELQDTFVYMYQNLKCV